MNNYVEPRGNRHRVIRVGGDERIRIPVRRNWFILFFLPFWLAGWTAGGVAAIYQLAQDFSWFLIFWLGGWAVGWIFAASTLLSQLFGAETIRIDRQDLEIRAGAWLLSRTWRYRGTAIRNLQSTEPANDMLGMRWRQMPIWIRPKSGAARFDYGADTIYFADGVDEPEGREIVAWLSRRLPSSALQID